MTTQTIQNDSPERQGEASGREATDGPVCACGCDRPVPAHARGSQPKYATGNCRRRDWDRRKYTGQSSIAFPRIKLTDPEIREAILRVLSDGQEHEIKDFVAATGATWARINPRLRDLRKLQYGGYDLPAARLIGERDGTKTYAYRLVKATPVAEQEGR